MIAPLSHSSSYPEPEDFSFSFSFTFTFTLVMVISISLFLSKCRMQNGGGAKKEPAMVSNPISKHSCTIIIGTLKGHGHGAHLDRTTGHHHGEH